MKKYNMLAQSRKDRVYTNNCSHIQQTNIKSQTPNLKNHQSNSKLLSHGKYQQIDNLSSTKNNNSSRDKLSHYKQQQLTRQTIAHQFTPSQQSITTKQSTTLSNHYNPSHYSQYRTINKENMKMGEMKFYPRQNIIQSHQQKIANSNNTKYNYLSNYEERNNTQYSRTLTLKSNNHHKHNESNNCDQIIHIKNTSKIQQQHHQNNKPSKHTTQIRSQTQSLHKPPQQSTIQQHKQNQPSINTNIQQQLTHLNRTISSLRKHPQLNDKFTKNQNYVTNSVQYNNQFSNSQKVNNVELYQIMKTILLEQERLEKQLQIIKNKNQQLSTQKLPQQLEFENIYNTNIADTFPLKEKRYTNPKITQIASKKPNNNISSVTVSPLSKHKQKSSKSPLRQKHTNEKESNLSRQDSNTKQRRCNSAIQSKNKSNKPGKITKNKQQFQQLYKQAQKQKYLNPHNTRLTISQQTKLHIWNRIKSTIQRSQLENTQSSNISHQNNRYINDHLVNTIQLQRKLKGDLVKKIYNMCENKCLYK